MYKLNIIYSNGCIEKYEFDTKEEVEEEVFFKWTEEAEFLVSRAGCDVFCFWEDRYDFNW